MSSLRDKIRAKRQQIQDKSAGQERPYKLLTGKTFFRILPGVADPEEFYQEIGLHWIKDRKGKTITAVGDRETCYGEPCPVRAAIERFIQISKDEGDDSAVEIGKEMLAKPRFFVNAVIVKAPGEFDSSKPVLLDLPQTVFDSILSQIEDQLEEVPEGSDMLEVGPFSLKNGSLFVIEKTGSGKESTRYNAYVHSTTKPHKVDRAIYESAIDLEGYKRAQFDGRTRKALAALGDMIGTDLTDLADKLAAPAAVRGAALPPPTGKAAAAAGSGAAGKAAAEDDDDILDGEIEDEADEAEAMSDDDILADLDDL